MKKTIIATCLALFAASASAQYIGTLPPNIDTTFNVTTDSDHFTTVYGAVGMAVESGWGVRYGEGYNSGKDLALVTGGANSQSSVVFSNGDSITTTAAHNISSKFSASQTSHAIQATYANVGENHNFYGAVGIKRITSNMVGEVTDTVTATTTTSISPSPSVVTSNTQRVSLPFTRERTQDVVVADVELKLILTDSLTVGLSASRDVVETAANAASGSLVGYTVVIGDTTVQNPNITPVIVDTAAADLDLQLSDNLSTYAQVGVAHFSNDNDRLFVHSKTTYTILPEYGVSVYARLKYQHDSNPTAGRQCVGDAIWLCVTPSYFSPDQRYSVLPGIQIRQAYNGLVYTASAEAGKQWTTVAGDTSAATIYSWQLGVQTQPGKRYGTTFGVNLFGTNANTNSSSDKYHWYGLYSWLKVPF